MIKKLILFVVLAIVALALPYQLSSYSVHAADVAMIYCLLAIGLYLTMGIAGQFNLAQVALFGVGAYTSGVLTTQTGLGFWPAAVCGIVAAVLVSLLVGIPALRVQSHYLAIVTLGLALAFVSVVSNLGIAGQAEGVNNLPPADLFGLDLSSDYLFYYLELIVLVGGIVFAAFVVGTRLGRRLQAMRDDDLAAAAMGAEVPILRMTAFAFGGAYGGVAGVLYAGLIRYVAPESFGLPTMFLLLAMVVIGGRHSLPGVVVGVIGLTIVRELLSDYSYFAQFAYGALVVLVVVFAPTGLAGVPARMIKLLRRGGGGSASKGVAPYVARLSAEQHGAAAVDYEAADAPVVLEVADVIKSFKGLRALGGVSFSVRQGEIRGIVGPNGSGKTTLFNVLSGVHGPSSGTVSILGQSSTNVSAYNLSLRGVARTFQNLRLFRLLSVRDNILVAMDRTRTLWSWRYVLWPVGVLSADKGMRRKADELLERYGLGKLADSAPGELSYGAQRRVEIARAMATSPKILLLDEPAAGLNGDEVNQLRAIVDDIRADGVTVLIIEHNMGLVMSMCDRVTVLATGSVIADGTPAEVVRVPQVIEAYLGDDAGLDKDLLEAAGPEVEEMKL